MVLPRYQHPQRKLYVGAAAALALVLMLLGCTQVLLVLLLLLLPVLVFFVWASKQQQHHGVTDHEIKQIALCFVAGIFPTPVLALVAQSLLVPLWAALCFFDQRASLDKQLRSFMDATDSSNGVDTVDAATVGSGSGSGSGSLQAQLQLPPHAPRFADALQQLDVDHTVGYYVFLFALAFCVAALVEEALKLWIVQGACRCCCSCSSSSDRRSRHTHPRGWLCDPSRLLFQRERHSSHAFVVFMAVVAGALGFSLFENVGYVFSADSFYDRVVAALLRAGVSTPLHCICGGLTGVRLAMQLQSHRRSRRGQPSTAVTTNDETKRSAADVIGAWRTKLRVLAPAIALHGTFDLQIFVIATAVTDDMAAAHPVAYGLVLPSVGTLILLAGGLWFLRRSLTNMEQQMHAGRYIQVAVDLESGRRVGFSDDDSDSDDDGEFAIGAVGAADGSDDARAFGRKTRTVFNV